MFNLYRLDAKALSIINVDVDVVLLHRPQVFSTLFNLVTKLYHHPETVYDIEFNGTLAVPKVAGENNRNNNPSLQCRRLLAESDLTIISSIESPSAYQMHIISLSTGLS